MKDERGVFKVERIEGVDYEDTVAAVVVARNADEAKHLVDWGHQASKDGTGPLRILRIGRSAADESYVVLAKHR